VNPAGDWLTRILEKGRRPLPRLVSAPASGAASIAVQDPHLCSAWGRGSNEDVPGTTEGSGPPACAHEGATPSRGTEGPCAGAPSRGTSSGQAGGRHPPRAHKCHQEHTNATRRFPGTGHGGPAWSGTEALAAAGELEMRERETKTTPAPGPRKPRLYLSPGRLALQRGHLLLQLVDAALRPLPVRPLRREVVFVGEDLREGTPSSGGGGPAPRVRRMKPVPLSPQEEEAPPRCVRRRKPGPLSRQEAAAPPHYPVRRRKPIPSLQEEKAAPPPGAHAVAAPAAPASARAPALRPVRSSPQPAPAAPPRSHPSSPPTAR